MPHSRHYYVSRHAAERLWDYCGQKLCLSGIEGPDGARAMLRDILAISLDNMERVELRSDDGEPQVGIAFGDRLPERLWGVLRPDASEPTRVALVTLLRDDVVQRKLRQQRGEPDPDAGARFIAPAADSPAPRTLSGDVLISYAQRVEDNDPEPFHLIVPGQDVAGYVLRLRSDAAVVPESIRCWSELRIELRVSVAVLS